MEPEGSKIAADAKDVDGIGILVHQGYYYRDQVVVEFDSDRVFPFCAYLTPENAEIIANKLLDTAELARAVHQEPPPPAS
jgi:hypothetical protein